MARIPQPDLLVDDLTGNPAEGIATYVIVDPADGKAYELDLGKDSFDSLVAALAPFLASKSKRLVVDETPSRKVLAEVKAAKADKPKAERKPAAYDALTDEQKAAWKASKLKADAGWKWAGRPSNDEIEAWLKKASKTTKADAA